MNSRGFTLIELLAVITIIAILSMIITPSITNMVKKNKVEACESLITSIERAANNYVSDYRYDSEVVSSNDFYIPVVSLISKNYLNKEIRNPLINNDTTDYSNDVVRVKFDTNSKTFSFKYEGNLDCTVS